VNSISASKAFTSSVGVYLIGLAMLKSMYCLKSFNVPIYPNKHVIRDDAGKAYSAYRLGGEKTAVVLPAGNLDLSILLSSRRTDPTGSEAASYLFIEVLKSVFCVRTNKLHVAIGSCISGAAFMMSVNSHFKVRAIYEHSLINRFPFCSWAWFFYLRG